MEKEKQQRKYKNDEFKINCFYDERGKSLNKIIEEAFKSFYELKTKV